jgi:hypothetical protein
MRGLSRLLAAIVGLALVSALVWAAAWWVDDRGHDRPDLQDWQSASSQDCDVMARALLAFSFAKRAKALPVIAKSEGSGRCDWSRYGLHLSTLTDAEFRARYPSFSAPESDFTEHIRLSLPTYSLLHVRVAVEVAHVYGNVGAEGYVCHLLLGLGGWKLQECRLTWMS